MSHIEKALNKVGKGIKQRAKGIGKALDKTFLEPSRRVNRIETANMQEMSRKAKAGELN